eukprot:1940957-Heterocapsa_arctica.AAC.1
MLSKFGAVRLTRAEAMNIVKMKKKAFNFFATMEVMQFVHVDHVVNYVDVNDMAHASAFRLYMECGNEHYAELFNKMKVSWTRSEDRRRSCWLPSTI